MCKRNTVLCIHDGTRISYSSRPKCAGLDVIGRNQTKATAKGVRLHTTLAATEDGLPLGILRTAYVPGEGPHAPGTQLWIDGLESAEEAATHLSRKTRVINVMDREGDNFALFDWWRNQKRGHLLVRVKKNRNVAHKRKLVQEVRSGAPDGFIEVPVTRQSYRAKSGLVLSEGRTARLTRMAVRFRQLELRPTDGYEGDPVPVWAIDVVEEAPPKQEAAIEWCLVTTVPVATVEEAIEMVGYYTQRWRIKDLFRVLKSGCKVEDLGMQDASSWSLPCTPS